MMNKPLNLDVVAFSAAGADIAMTEEQAAVSGPHPIDRHVGLRIRMRRKELGMTQEKLAQALGLTFQQVQKYERGANRVSASKLWEMARALKAPVAYFYDGLGEDAETQTSGSSFTNAQDFLLTSEGIELAATFPRISRGRLRRKVLELVRLMAEEEDVVPAETAELETA